MKAEMRSVLRYLLKDPPRVCGFLMYPPLLTLPCSQLASPTRDGKASAAVAAVLPCCSETK